MTEREWLLLGMFGAILLAVLFHLWWDRRQTRKRKHVK